MSSFISLLSSSEPLQVFQDTPFHAFFIVLGITLLETKITKSTWAVGLVAAVLGPLVVSWLRVVTNQVHEPYLDEVFHIPQAQVYCEGRYLDWDDKITTPPGLYILTVIYNRLMGRPCHTYDIRSFNMIVTLFIASIALACRSSYRKLGRGQNGNDEAPSGHDIWTGLNIACFPVILFFSGLYYTDPLSTAVVLLAYLQHLSPTVSGSSSYLYSASVVVLGIFALLNRQTNVFWVVGYLGGLGLIRSIKQLKPAPVETPEFQDLSGQVRFYLKRYSLGDIHDPPVGLAYPVDIALCVMSIAIAAICNVHKILRVVLFARGLILAAFVIFVFWNGGVVLGDKSNHVATIHLPQMLYIWPLFTFFSAPLFIPKILKVFKITYQVFTTPQAPVEEKSIPDSASKQSAALQLFNRIGCSHVLHRILLASAALVGATLIVRFNTIIHPFTLADNRHYMFYVFRYSILRAWWIRYALVPVYVACSWLCWAALQGCSPPRQEPRPKWVQSPFSSPTQEAEDNIPAVSLKKEAAEDSSQGEESSPPISTVLLLLLTTTLSLITAPLVEPRYFILPWVFWRLLVPAYSPRSKNGQRKVDPTLILESIWFLLVNVVTMYVFLQKPFFWYAPDSTLLDEGRVQRFMW